jgi:hypothetical protein
MEFSVWEFEISYKYSIKFNSISYTIVQLNLQFGNDLYTYNSRSSSHISITSRTSAFAARKRFSISSP